ncbi:MAG TPA: tetratricopeptide repeat protein [Patescibacteria group bacterium]|nr:tetratricopeptide repeat protein [Patescibacteria group bacterium]
MESDLAHEAISAALCCDWEKATLLNLEILKSRPEDIDAMNRLARAYAESGNIKKATELSEKVLKIDANNTIALKCVEKWKNFKPGNGTNHKIAKISFIEEPARTKIVSLTNLGDKETIMELSCGDAVKIDASLHKVSVATFDDKYIGRFPDNIALKFISLFKLGGEYEASVKTADRSSVKIFVRALKNGF